MHSPCRPLWRQHTRLSGNGFCASQGVQIFSEQFSEYLKIKSKILKSKKLWTILWCFVLQIKMCCVLLCAPKTEFCNILQEFNFHEILIRCFFNVQSQTSKWSHLFNKEKCEISSKHDEFSSCYIKCFYLAFLCIFSNCRNVFY